MKKNKCMLLMTLGVIAVTASSCSDEARWDGKIPDVAPLVKASEISLSGIEENAIDKLTDLSFAMNAIAQEQSREVFGANTSGNNQISPMSTLVSLAMVVNGMDAPVADKVAAQLGFDNVNSLNQFVNKLLRYLPGASEYATVVFANAVWMHNAYTPSQAYANVLQKTFAVPVASLDFTERSTINTINAWCNSNTGGLIPSIVDYLSVDIPVETTSALYFDSKWFGRFNKENTVTQPFYGVDKTSDVAMMHKDEYAFASDEDARMTSLGFEGRYTFDVIMANEGSDWTPASITKEQYTALVNSLDYQSYVVKLALPRFKTETTADLTDVFDAMRIPEADFTMTSAGLPEAIVFDKFVVKQKSSLEINEDGAKAAVVTVTGPLVSSTEPKPRAEVEMTVNRPFFYALRDTKYNTILLMGCVNNL